MSAIKNYIQASEEEMLYFHKTTKAMAEEFKQAREAKEFLQSIGFPTDGDRWIKYPKIAEFLKDEKNIDNLKKNLKLLTLK